MNGYVIAWMRARPERGDRTEIVPEPVPPSLQAFTPDSSLPAHKSHITPYPWRLSLHLLAPCLLELSLSKTLSLAMSLVTTTGHALVQYA